MKLRKIVTTVLSIHFDDEEEMYKKLRDYYNDEYSLASFNGLYVELIKVEEVEP